MKISYRCIDVAFAALDCECYLRTDQKGYEINLAECVEDTQIEFCKHDACVILV